MSLEAAINGLTAELKRYNDAHVVAPTADPAPAKPAGTKAAKPAAAKAAEPAPTAPAEPEAPATEKVTLAQLQEKCVELVTDCKDAGRAELKKYWASLKVERASDMKDDPAAMAVALKGVSAIIERLKANADL